MSVKRLLRFGRKKPHDDPTVIFRPLPRKDRYIRLVKFEPESVDERYEYEGTLRCKVEVYAWDGQIPDYNALSYVWGLPEVGNEIICNGVYHFVTSNLERALRSCYWHLKSPYLWCDQLCINQSDLEEKSAQVSMMTEIYRRAGGVQAWLGDIDKGDDFELLHDYANWVLLKTCGPKWNMFGARTSISNWNPRYNLDEDQTLMRSAQRAFLTFLEREWFTRGWVVQEASAHYFNMTYAIGTSIYRNIDVLRVAHYTEACLVHGHPPRYNDRLTASTNDAVIYMPLSFLSRVTMLTMHTETLKKGKFPTDDLLDLQFLLEVFPWCQTSDPRDKIYSLLSLATDRAAYNSIDYRLPAKDIFYSYWTTLFRKSNYDKALKGLSFAASLPALEDCPSWARDLGYLISPSFNSDTTYSAGGLIEPGDVFRFKDKIITLKGYVVDEIEAIVPVNLFHWFHLENNGDSFNEFKKQRHVVLHGDVNPDVPITKDLHFNYFGNDNELVWVSELSQWKRNSKTAGSSTDWEDVVHDLGSLVMLDGTSKRFPLSGNEEELFSLFARSRWDSEGNAIVWPEHSKQSNTSRFDRERYIDLLNAILRGGERLFISKTGRLGLCNPGSFPGDKIILVKGASMPFIMRNNPEFRKLKYGQWELMSEAYVRGVMFGEVIPRHWDEIQIV